jgi:hypothetical protein
MIAEAVSVDTLVSILAKMPHAAPTLPELAEATGLDDDQLGDLLAEADLAGLIETWEDSAEGPAIILSKLAADRAGLRLEEATVAKGRMLFKWVKASYPEIVPQSTSGSRTKVASQICGRDQSPSEFWETIPDESPASREPVEIIGDVEELERALPPNRTDKGAEKLIEKLWPRPTILLGLRQQWSAIDAEGPCIGCQGRPLGTLEVCVRCDRSGLDFLFPPLPEQVLKRLAKFHDLLNGLEPVSKLGARMTVKRPSKASGGSLEKFRRAKAKKGREKAERALARA